ncbi:MAG TPA: FAD-dependent oxidoreductase [Bacillota bacterium]|nr:FAD-dependent oxidoreductase [Bacillota bacterium]
MRIAIVGGGIVGAALAAELLNRTPKPEVVLFEAETQPGLGATSKATGGLRHQFTHPLLVQLSLLSVPVYRAMPEAGFRDHGYLFVTSDPERLRAMRQAAEMQQGLGVPAAALAPQEIGALVPGIRTDDLAGGTFCAWDGSASPTDALVALLRTARARGLDLRMGTPAERLLRCGGQVTGLRAGGEDHHADAVVVAAGAWSIGFLASEGIPVPVGAYRRQVFVMTPPPGFQHAIPMTIDQDTGWYVHPERSGMLLFGGTDHDDRPGMEEVVDWDGLPRVLEGATRRIPALAEAGLVRGYAGVRALTQDDLPILGRAEDGLYLSVGWGGHGFMHAPGGAMVLADLILTGGTERLDAAALAPGHGRG